VILSLLTPLTVPLLLKPQHPFARRDHDVAKRHVLGGEPVVRVVHRAGEPKQGMRPEKLAAWRVLRERYGNRDKSTVDQGTLMAPAA